MSTRIKAKKDLFNGGQCFTKGRIYTTLGTYKEYLSEASLMEAQTTNDQGEPHIIGSWWRNFSIVKSK